MVDYGKEQYGSLVPERVSRRRAATSETVSLRILFALPEIGSHDEEARGQVRLATSTWRRNLQKG